MEETETDARHNKGKRYQGRVGRRSGQDERHRIKRYGESQYPAASIPHGYRRRWQREYDARATEQPAKEAYVTEPDTEFLLYERQQQREAGQESVVHDMEEAKARYRIRQRSGQPFFSLIQIIILARFFVCFSDSIQGKRNIY
jgi:hypothetical protein